jgi:hypothetical protein
MRKEIRARKARRTHGGPNVLIIAPQYIAGSFACNATGGLPENRAFAGQKCGACKRQYSIGAAPQEELGVVSEA